MPLVLKLDLAKDAEIEQSLLNGFALTRVGIVSGITSAVTTSQLALIDILNNAPGMPQLGDFLSAGHHEYVCLHRIARPVQNTSGQKAWVWIRYETPGGGGTPLERFAAEDVANLVAEPSDVFPGTAQQIRCSTTATAPQYTSLTPPDTDRPVKVNWPRVMRGLVLYGLFANRPSGNVLNATNCVNDGTWQGLDRGYWRCEGPRVRYSSRDGMYAVSVGFSTKGAGRGRDWSTYEIARSADGTQAGVKTSDLIDAYNEQYEYGLRNDVNGFWKGGLYELANFSQIFGDSFPIG